MHVHVLLFAHAHTHPCLYVPAHTVVRPCPSPLSLIHALAYPFMLVSAGPHLSPLICLLHWLALVLITAHSCSSPFVCWSPFIPARLCPLGCAGSCSVVLVPATWLCLFGFRLCSLVFAWVCLCWFGFFSRLFGLRHAHLCFDGVGSERKRAD